MLVLICLLGLTNFKVLLPNVLINIYFVSKVLPAAN